MTSSLRNSLIVAAASVAAGYAFFRADTFWGVVFCGLTLIWSLITALPIMDSGWRFKVGFTVAVFFGSLFILWPTFEELSKGKVKAPAYVKENITFGIVKGLDLQGGLRLVYTVEVEEAIRDKRDKFADEMRQELALAYNIHKGEGLLKREELVELEKKVHVAGPPGESALL